MGRGREEKFITFRLITAVHLARTRTQIRSVSGDAFRGGNLPPNSYIYAARKNAFIISIPGWLVTDATVRQGQATLHNDPISAMSPAQYWITYLYTNQPHINFIIKKVWNFVQPRSISGVFPWPFLVFTLQKFALHSARECYVLMTWQYFLYNFSRIIFKILV